MFVRTRVSYRVFGLTSDMFYPNFEYVSQKSVIVIFAEYMWGHQQTLKSTSIKVQMACYLSLPTP
jgi:hypothetical protein